MKLTRILATSAIALVLSLSAATADQQTDNAAKELKAQTNCPVMGGKIDSAAYTDIQGQRVYHCCPGCSAKLKADPDKYFKKAAEEGVLFENIQTACPVTGKAFDKAIYTDYVGRRIYFATEAAKAKFTKKPDKYLAVLDEQVGNKPAAKSTSLPAEKMESHGGHGAATAGGCGH